MCFVGGSVKGLFNCDRVVSQREEAFIIQISDAAVLVLISTREDFREREKVSAEATPFISDHLKCLNNCPYLSL